jgi:hypothetical protein
VSLVNILSLMQAVYEEGGSYYELIKETLQSHPSDPDHSWHLILYFDEITPGDPVGYANDRKFWVCYAAFKEFGAKVLSNEACWLPVLELRTARTSKMAAGISQIAKLIMRHIFLNDNCDVARGGLVLKGPDDELKRVFFGFGYLVQDGAAHKYVFCTKSDKGLKMCILCKNIFAVESDVVDDETGERILLPSIRHESQCDFATNDDIQGSMARLRHKSATLSPRGFDKWQKASGFNYEPHGLLQDAALESVVKPADDYVHDWMHALFVGGVFQTVMFLTLGALQAALRIPMYQLYSTFADYIQLWQHPLAKHDNKLHEVFAKKRAESNQKAKAFKCKASDGLGLFPIIAMWLLTMAKPGGICILECTAFICMCDMIEALVACAHVGVVTPDYLSEVIEAFMAACERADWAKYMHPKFHWLVHFPMHLANHGFLIACFVHERLHRVSKRYANDIRNTSDYEASLLRQVLCHTIAKLREPGLFDMAVGAMKLRHPPKKALQFLSEAFGAQLDASSCGVSTVARLHDGSVCTKKDVVLMRSPDGTFHDAAEVWLHAKCLNQYVSLVSIWKLIRYDEPKGLAYWQKSDNPKLVNTNDILCSVTYRNCENAVAAVLVPLLLR